MNNNNNKPKNTSILISANLLGDDTHKDFLALQTEYGIAQRGGAYPFTIIPPHVNRLTSDVNLLSSVEKKQLIFSGTIFNN
ncbi:MAG: hypothetical protein H0W73_02945 [Bacteroidetes bacterium]|nr:hypothetical protein [Bacteroidota bacterium]